MKTLIPILLIMTFVSGCAFLQNHRIQTDDPELSTEVSAPQSSSELLNFVVNNYEGAQSVINDPLWGHVLVTVGARYISASGYECIQATLGHSANDAELLAICHKNTGWVLAPRICAQD